MGPKKKHNTNKSSKSSSSSARASKGAAKVQLSAENESKLRRLLQNNSNFNTNTANSSEPSAGASLEISTDGQRKQIEKRLKNIYDALCSEGFDSSQIERVLAALPMGQQTLESALDWLCFNLSSEELPRKFSSGLTASALEGESVQLLSVARHDWTSAERSDEVDISLEKYIILNPRERKDDKQESNAAQADWIRQYVAQEAEDNDAESSKSEGSGDLEPQFIDPVIHAKEVKTELFLAKQAAADAKKAGDKDKQTTASHLIRKLRKELASLGIADDDAHGTKEMDKTENERWRRLSEGIVHDVDTFPSLSIDGGAEGSSSFIPAGANNQVGDAGPRPTRSTPQVTFSGNSHGVGQQAKGANVALDLNSDSLEKQTKVEKSSSTESGKKETGFEGVNRCEDPEATLDGDEMLTLFEEETSNMGSLPQTVVESQQRDKFIPWGTEGSTSKKDLVAQGRKGSKATSQDTHRQPKAVLQQQCQKMGWLAPQYQRVGGDIDKAIYAVTVVRTTSGRGKNKVVGGPITFSLPTNEEAFSSILEAQNAVAAWALCQLFSELPLYRLLQEPFRSMCLRWHVEAKELQDKEAENQGLRRESFLKSLVNSTSINIPNQNTASEYTSKLVDTADKKLEDSMVTTSHLLHKHQDGESESAKEANSQYLLSLMHNKMRNKKYKEMAQSRNSLPIAAIKEQLLKVLVQGDVVVVSGETGSGKTTQVPQFILDEMIMNGCGGFCNIICTQPRRIAAISVAERVAAERCEPGPGENGSLIGYQVRLHTAWNQRTRLLFCTTGILLRRLTGDRDLNNVSHIIVDEVHERTVLGDFLLVLVKELLERRRVMNGPALKVILMSATMDSERLSSYFGDCPILIAKGRTYPVNTIYLEDIYEHIEYRLTSQSAAALQGGLKTSKKHLRNQVGSGRRRQDLVWSGFGDDAILEDSLVNPLYNESLYKDYNAMTRNNLALVNEDVIDYELLEDLVIHIAEEGESGAMLIFLPGLAEIQLLLDRLTASRKFKDLATEWLLALHSSIAPDDQRKVFRIPPQGVRKIVLATNIAETSVTIPDVVHVIDCGKHKENRFDPHRGMSRMLEVWISQANARQRKGRAGRVQPGNHFCLYTKYRFENLMHPFQLPEMLRVPLVELCLQIKLLSINNMAAFLQKALDPPKLESVETALATLREVGAVNEQEELTALGYHLAALPVDVRIGKMMLYGALFGCLNPVLTIAACLSHKSPFLVPQEQKNAAERAKKAFSDNAEKIHFEDDAPQQSDHLAMVAAYNGWRQIVTKKGAGAARGHCQANFLSMPTLKMIRDMRNQFAMLLLDMGFIKFSQVNDSKAALTDFADNLTQPFNFHAQQPAVIKAALCAGLYPNVAAMDEKSVVEGHASAGSRRAGLSSLQKPRWSDGRREVFIHPSSVNADVLEFWHPFLVFHEKVETSRVFLRDTSVISPYAILLFGGAISIQHQTGHVTVDGWLEMKAAAQTAVLFKELRIALDSVLRESIEKPQENMSSRSTEVIRFIIELILDETKIAV